MGASHTEERMGASHTEERVDAYPTEESDAPEVIAPAAVDEKIFDSEVEKCIDSPLKANAAKQFSRGKEGGGGAAEELMDRVKEEWNEQCGAYPRINLLSERRRHNLQRCIKAMGGAKKARDTFTTLLGKMKASSFLQGRNQRGWKASFDWLTGPQENWIKVLEGNYDDAVTAAGYEFNSTYNNHLNNTSTYERRDNYATDTTSGAQTYGYHRQNGTRSGIFGSADAAYQARRADFEQHIIDKLTNPRPRQPDISRYYFNEEAIRQRPEAAG